MGSRPESETAIAGTGPRHHAGFTLLPGTVAILALAENDSVGSRCRSPRRIQTDVRRVRNGHLPKHKRGCDSPVGGKPGCSIYFFARKAFLRAGISKPSNT
jgi:hypothetical protein